MDYREVKKQHEKENYRTGRVYSFRELLEIPSARKPHHGDHWANWELDTERWVLTHRKGHYELDLERLGQTSSAMLDAIFQVRTKGWHTDDDMAALLEAFDDLLHPQATLCSCGMDKTMDDPAKFMTTMVESVI